MVSANIASGQIGGAHVAAAGLVSANYASGSIGSAHLGFSIVGLTSGDVVSGYIGNAAVVSGSIASGQIAWPHIAAGGLLSTNYASGSIGGANIASGGILSAAIASGQIGGFHVGAGLLISANYASGSIGGFHIASAGIISGNYGSGSIGGAHIASGEMFPPTNFRGVVQFGISGQVALIYSGLGAGMAFDTGARELDIAINLNLSGTLTETGRVSWLVGLNVPADYTYFGRAPLGTSSWIQVANIYSGGARFPGIVSTFQLNITSGIGGVGLIVSNNFASGLAHHIEAFITSTDTNGIWSAAWKAAFGAAPSVHATALVRSGVGSGTVYFAGILNATTALVNGGLYEPGGLAGNVFPAGSGAVHVMAHDPTA